MEIKFNCPNPNCRQRISVDESMAGRSLSCPACATMLEVPKSMHIKFNCSNQDCGQHIVVDVSEAGRFVKCPSCGKPLQVPGAPPKPIVSKQILPVLEKRPDLPASKKRSLPLALIPFKRLLFGWGIGAALCGLIIGGLHLHAWASLPRHFDAMLDETYFHGEILIAPVVNNTGTALLYVRTVETGVGVFRVNLITLERTQIALAKAADKDRGGSVKLFGWSPDDRYMAFSTIKDGNENRHIAICDGADGKELNSFETPKSVEMGAWLSAKSLVLLDSSHNLLLFNLETDGHLGQFGMKGLVQLRQLDRTGGWLVRGSDQSIAYVEQGNVWRFDISANREVQLTQLTNSVIEWLDYNAANNKYLFDVVDGASKQKSLYQLDPGGTETPLVALNCANYEFKGQWLQGDSGVAYVGLEGNRYYLGVETKDPALRTNLFTAPKLNPNSGLLNRQDVPEGRQVVRTFSVSPKRDKIYTVASVNYEPLGIWEYDIVSKSLRNVVPVKEKLIFSKFIAPVQASVTNPNGQTIDYYYLPPANLDPNKKYPMVMDQFSDLGFQPNSQFLANAGIFYVTVNPYGVGRPERPTNPEDTIAVYEEMLKNPNVDPHRIYVSGDSAGTYTVAGLISDHPDFWRGAIILSPVTFQYVSRDTKMVPSIFFSFGTDDDMATQQRLEQYALEACAHHTVTQIQYEKAGHVFFAIDENKMRYKAVATFILENR